jgi:predicted choloylglycine hydrolase
MLKNKSKFIFLIFILFFTQAVFSQEKNYKIIRLKGNPFEIGEQMGKFASEEIKNIYKEYVEEKISGEWIKMFKLVKKDIDKNLSEREIILKFAKNMEKYIPEKYIQEMKGLSKSTGISYEDILIMTTHGDFFAILCSGFSVTGPLTKTGKIISGRNFDWGYGTGEGLDKYVSVIVYQLDKGFPFVSINYPGVIGVATGMNIKGLAVQLNYSMGKENNLEGMPVILMVREILENAKNLKEAEEIIKNTKRTACFNILISSKEDNKSKVFEITGKRYRVREMKEDYIITTNHFVSEDLKSVNIDSPTAIFDKPDTHTRYERLEELIKENKGNIDAEVARKFMHDFDVMKKSTLYTTIFEPEELNFWIWRRGKELFDFEKFNLKELLKY